MYYSKSEVRHYVKLIILLGSVSMSPLPTYSVNIVNVNTSTVENNIKVEASSGSNSVNKNTTKSGNASVNIISKTIIDGKIVEDINENLESEGSVQINKTNSLNNSTVTTNISASVATSSPASGTSPKQTQTKQINSLIKNTMVNKDLIASSSNDVSSMFVDLQGQQLVSTSTTGSAFESIGRGLKDRFLNFIKYVFTFF